MTGRAVLLIDDNPDALEMTSVLLEMFHYRVLRSRSGKEAIRLAQEELPEVAVIDIGMPELNGYDLARRLRADLRTRDMRLIALTGYGRPEDIESALEAGFDIHLVKPVDFDRLRRAIDAEAHC